MSNFLNQHTVLVLNSLWQAIGTITPQKAITALNSSSDGISLSAKSINITYGQNEDGTWNLTEAIEIVPLYFEEWLSVPIREGLDNIIHSPKLSIRCPSVLVTNYSKMPMRKLRPTKSVLYEKQDGRCGYSGERIGINSSSIEHKHPRSFGGKDTFENLMIVKKEINHRRGNRPMADLGLIPLFHHREPQPIPISYTIKNIKHPDWVFFIYK